MPASAQSTPVPPRQVQRDWAPASRTAYRGGKVTVARSSPRTPRPSPSSSAYARGEAGTPHRLKGATGP